jgi:hypothetical protein
MDYVGLIRTEINSLGISQFRPVKNSFSNSGHDTDGRTDGYGLRIMSSLRAKAILYKLTVNI